LDKDNIYEDSERLIRKRRKRVGYKKSKKKKV